MLVAGHFFSLLAFFFARSEAWLLPSVFTSAVCRSGHAADLSETAKSVHSHVV